MLTFDSHQQKTFDGNARQREAERLLPIMRRNFPEEAKTLDDGQLGAIIQRALDRASQWKIETRAGCTNFVILWILLGADFDQAPEIKNYLETPEYNRTEKINALMNEFKLRLQNSNRN